MLLSWRRSFPQSALTDEVRMRAFMCSQPKAEAGDLFPTWASHQLVLTDAGRAALQALLRNIS
jgi:hypothetical protein